ncbi:MAG: DUF3021 domain-containing protein [Lachnospiraceae bacterium]|nr:DUF3021 domain-containing protein [Lachnospiraceae bacterium]
MTKFQKKALILSSIGFVIGCAIGIFIFIATAGEDFRFSQMSLAEILIGGIYGALGMGGSVSYDVEQWGLLRATLTHLIPALIAFYLMGYLQGWLMPGSTLFWIMTVAWLLVYAAIWLTMYLGWRRKIRKMNEELKALKK